LQGELISLDILSASKQEILFPKLIIAWGFFFIAILAYFELSVYLASYLSYNN